MKSLSTFFALLLLTTLHASGAIITWGSATDVSAETDVSLNGTLVEAFNLSYDGNPTDPIVNGVTFESIGSLLDNSADLEFFTGNISANYNELLGTLDYGGGTSPTLSLGGGGLIPGELYEIQIWYGNSRDANRVMRFTDNQGGSSVDLGGGSTQYAIGTFTADGFNQNLQLLPQGFSKAHINAYQIRALSSGAAPGIITWGPVTDVSAETDVSLNGDPVIAVNAAADSVTDELTINGVVFESTGSLLANSSTADIYGGSISADYDQLLSNVDFGGGSSPTLALGGGRLVAGGSYEIQIWFADTRNNRVMRFTDNQGGDSIDLGGGVAQYAIGNFTANGTNQNLQLLPQGFSDAHVNAYQIRLLSLGSGLVGFFAEAVDVGDDTFEVTLNFSTDVTGLLESELVVTDGTLVNSSLSGSGAAYSFRLTSTNPGGFTVSLPADSVEDTGDNMNALISRTFTAADIITGPIPTLYQTHSTVSAPYDVTVHFDQAISGLTLSDFTITNGTLSNFIDHTLLHAGNIANYSVTVTPTAEGPVTLTLPITSVTSDSTGVGNMESNTLVADYQLSPNVEINGSIASSSSEFDVFFSFTPHITGFDSSDVVVTNGSIVSFEMQGRREYADRFYKATIQALTPGEVTIFVPAGSATNRDHPSSSNTASNVFTTTVSDQFGEDWVIDSASEWTANLDSSSDLTLADGFAEPSASATGIYSSVIHTFSKPQFADKLTFTQTPVWSADKWTEAGNISPSGAGDAPIFLPIGNDDYYFFAANSGSYHAWHSTDMSTWTKQDQFTNDGVGRGTSAEYKDGTFYLLVDTPNDHTPSMYTDTDLNNGQPGIDHGIVIPYGHSGGDSALFLDNADDLFHIISEDHSPILAKDHSWDSPLAQHVTSVDGINGFVPDEHLPALDIRTEPTGTFGTYNHPHVSGTPISNPRPYEIHIGEQKALGDWSIMKVGDRYYTFSDYEHDDHSGFINTGISVSNSLYESFELVADIGDGHPDPTSGFAEGQFYLITQQSTDYVSSGPWVDGVQARAGVDTDNNGSIDQWTGWQTLTESYDHTPGYSRVITVTPAEIDMSSLPAGYGFQFELQLDDTIVPGSTPIMDQVKMSFSPSNFQTWSNTLGIPADESGDYNANNIADLIEFVIGQDTLPERLEDGSYTFTIPSEALADGYSAELQFSTNLTNWDTATISTDGVKILTVTNHGNGDVETMFQIESPTGENKVFWRIKVL
ncbi:Ig-like domain-containing protein [Haloferula sp.]|uniref:Ig-like domain-containing protein n=1 Tax=Haloferula sp. TaxID=2497595 RepID=UPI00329F8480